MNKFLIARGIVQEVTRCLPGATMRLSTAIIQRVPRGMCPGSVITAPLCTDRGPTDPDKGLLPQREAYFDQSRRTVAGSVAPFRWS